MGEIPKYDGSRLPDFPSQLGDLLVAREQFVKLFETEQPLRELGYSQKQMQIAAGPLSLIMGEGMLEHPPQGPMLTFSADDYYSSIVRDYEHSRIVGHHLFSFLPGTKPNLFGSLFGADPSPIFKDSDMSLDLHLFDPKLVDPENIHQLIQFFYLSGFGTTEAPLLPSNKLTDAVGKTGMVDTYQACWLDKNHTTLAVELKVWSGKVTDYNIWKRISDQGLGIIPMGRMPDAGGKVEAKVKKAFEEVIVTTGNLGWQPG